MEDVYIQRLEAIAESIANGKLWQNAGMPCAVRISLYLLMLWRNSPLAEGRQPEGSPAVARVDQRTRIFGPCWLYIVAGCVSESLPFACIHASKPKVPVAMIELAVSHPVAIW